MVAPGVASTGAAAAALRHPANVLAALLALVALVPGAEARSLRQPETALAMANLEGTACSDEEHARYKTIVCEVQQACQCLEGSSTNCELDWCNDYVHTWKKDFAACQLKGC